MLSIFCPYRDRPGFYEDFVYHYRQHYPLTRIYMLEQDDKSPFKRGQLMNAGFKYLLANDVLMENILFVDVDIRLKYRINFQGLLEEHKTLVIPFNHLSLYTLESKGVYVPLNKPSYFLDTPDGGVTLFTKDMFMKCGGFSNLYIGWGIEDTDLLRRVPKVTRVENEMIHLEHNRMGEWKSPEFKRNKRINDLQLPSSLDGFRQTTSETTMKEIEENIFHLKIKNIGVVEDYVYISKM